MHARKKKLSKAPPNPVSPDSRGIACNVVMCLFCLFVISRTEASCAFQSHCLGTKERTGGDQSECKSEISNAMWQCIVAALTRCEHKTRIASRLMLKVATQNTRVHVFHVGSVRSSLRRGFFHVCVRALVHVIVWCLFSYPPSQFYSITHSCCFCRSSEIRRAPFRLRIYSSICWLPRTRELTSLPIQNNYHYFCCFTTHSSVPLIVMMSSYGILCMLCPVSAAIACRVQVLWHTAH